MPHIASIGTYLPCWGTPHRSFAGAEKTMAVEAGRAAPAPPHPPTTEASSGLFALAALAESDTIGPLVAVERAGSPGITVAGGDVPATGNDAVRNALFGMAWLTPADIDVAEVYDRFTGIALISYEHRGFAERDRRAHGG